MRLTPRERGLLFGLQFLRAWLLVLAGGFSLVLGAILIAAAKSQPVWQSALAVFIYGVLMFLGSKAYRFVGWLISKTKADIEAFQGR